MTCRAALHRQKPRRRSGKVLVFVVVALPAILGVLGLVFDAGLLMSDSRNLQHAVDAGSTAAAMDLLLGKPADNAQATAESYIHDLNGATDSSVSVNIPPLSGPFSGEAGHVEVIANGSFQTRIMHLLGVGPDQGIQSRAVAGVEDSTEGAAIVILDPDPEPISVTGVPPLLPALPALVGGLEILGIGTLRVDGAVLVNTTWGGVDENGDPAGESAGPPYGISCMPILSTSRLAARDIRVAGGVDNAANYSDFEPGEDSPLQANRLPVPDPFLDLPVPTTSSDGNNVNTAMRGGVQVTGLPLIDPPTVLQPGVYEWISVLSGTAVFEPGVYIIRNKNPDTNLSLSLTAGTISANGVLFYITDSAGYDASSGAPDSGDGETAPAAPAPGALTASVVINAALPDSSISGLDDPTSPFHQMLVYQRRQDRRPIALVHQGLIGGGTLSGTVYSKWGHVILIGTSNYDLRIVSGTARIIAVTDVTFAPETLLPPAQDVYLLE